MKNIKQKKGQYLIHHEERSILYQRSIFDPHEERSVFLFGFGINSMFFFLLCFYQKQTSDMLTGLGAGIFGV